MRVVVEDEHSESVYVASGVPQDTVLGPLLFLCKWPAGMDGHLKLQQDLASWKSGLKIGKWDLTLKSVKSWA